jgi:rod shape determining protein RodA
MTTTTSATGSYTFRRDRVSVWRQIDPFALLAALAITTLGVIVVYSATRGPGVGAPVTSFLQRQAVFAAGGVLLMGIVMAFDFRHIREILPVLYVGLLGLLALVLVAGVEVNGARAWFRVASFQLQPSEFGKLVLIASLAVYFGNGPRTPTFPRVLGAIGVAGVPIAMIMLQPDLGTVLVYGAILAAVLIVVGTKGRHLALFALLLVGASVLVVNLGVLDDYQVDRLTAFVDDQPSSANQGVFEHQQNAQIAIGNGGVLGQGLFNGIQNRSASVPEQQTDFIFTVVGEELGFVGSAVLIALYGLLIFRILRIAALAHEFTGTLLCVGVLAMFVFQVFESIGMTMGIMPITGIPLPFVSYGGSSILTSFMAIGLVESVHMRRYA